MALNADTLSAARQRAANGRRQVAIMNKDMAKVPELKGARMLDRQWDDIERPPGSAYGPNITDKYIQTAIYQVDADGNEIPGSATPWTPTHTMSLSSNFDDPTALISSKHFNMVVADPDGTNKRYMTLDEVFGSKFTSVFRDQGLNKDSKMDVDKVVVAEPQYCFIEMPPDDTWRVKIRFTSFSYNTAEASKPKNAQFVSDSTTTSMHLERPGHEGQQALYHKLLLPNGKWYHFSTDIHETDRELQDMGAERKATSKAEADRGRGAQVHTGPISWGPSTSCVFLISAELRRQEPDDLRSLDYGAEGNAIYRSLGADDDDEYDYPELRGPGARSIERVRGKEARTALGSNEGEAPPLEQTLLCGTKDYARVQPLFFGVFPCKGQNGALDIETLKQAHTIIKTKHAQSVALGEDIHRQTQAAVDAGMAGEPLTKKSKTTINANTGQAIFPVEPAPPPTPALPPKPLLTGVPV